MREPFKHLEDEFNVVTWGAIVIGDFDGCLDRNIITDSFTNVCVLENKSRKSNVPAPVVGGGNYITAPYRDIQLWGGDSKYNDTIDFSTLNELVCRYTNAAYNILIVLNAYEFSKADTLFDRVKDFEAVYIYWNEGILRPHHYMDRMRLNGYDLTWLSNFRNGAGTEVYVRKSGKSIKSPIVDLSFDGTNVALDKLSSQSSVSKFSLPDDAQGAVAGRRTGGFNFHTDIEEAPWWQVDLGSSIAISKIVIFNRIDIGSNRSNTMKVLVGDNRDQLHLIHDRKGNSFGGADGCALIIKCFQMPMRWIRIQLSAREYLHLDAVEVYSTVES